MAGALQEDERGLFESAVGDDGLADERGLAVEVIDAAAGQVEARVGFKLLAGMALADLTGLIDGELVFEGQEDHADGGDDLGHDDGANSPKGGLAMMDEREGLADIERPGQEAEAGKDGPGRDAAKDIEDEKGGDAVDGAFNVDEGPIAPNADTDPETGGAEDDAEGEGNATRNTAVGDGPGASGE